MGRINENDWRECGLVKSWVEQARGWRGLRGQTLLGVDERVNRVIVGPWTKDGFNEKYWALWSKSSGTRSQVPVNCDSPTSLLDHPGLKRSARRRKIPCRNFCIYTPYSLCWALLVTVWCCTNLWGSLKAMSGFSSRAYGKGSVMFPVHWTFSYLCYCREH